MSIFAYGYGCYLDSLTIKEKGAFSADAEKIFNLFPESLKCDYEDEWDSCKKDYESEMEFFDEFIMEYEDGNGGFGIECLIARLINENEFKGRPVVVGEEMCIYAPLFFPETEKDREKIPLQKDLKKAFEKYLSLFYEDTSKTTLNYFLFEEL